MRTWIASASLALAITAGAALPAAANQLDNGHPFATQQTCGYVWSGNHYDWRCANNGAPLQWQTYTPPRQSWNGNNGFTQQSFAQQQAWNGGGRVSEGTIRQQLYWGGYREVDNIRFDDHDNVYRVMAKDTKGRDVKLVLNAYGQVIGRTTNTHD